MADEPGKLGKILVKGTPEYEEAIRRTFEAAAKRETER